MKRKKYTNRRDKMKNKHTKTLMTYLGVLLAVFFMLSPYTVLANNVFYEITGYTSNNTSYEAYFKGSGENVQLYYLDWANLSTYEEVSVLIDGGEISRYNGWNFSSNYSIVLDSSFLESYDIGPHSLTIRAKQAGNDYYEEASITLRILDLYNQYYEADSIVLNISNQDEINNQYITVNPLSSIYIPNTSTGTTYIDGVLVNETQAIIPSESIAELYIHQEVSEQIYSVTGTCEVENTSTSATYIANYETTLTITKEEQENNEPTYYDGISNYEYHLGYEGPVEINFSLPNDTTSVEMITINGDSWNDYTNSTINLSYDYLNSLSVGQYNITVNSYDFNNYIHYVTSSILTILEDTNTEINITEDVEYHLNYQGPVTVPYQLPSTSIEIESIKINDYDMNQLALNEIILDKSVLNSLGIGEYELIIEMHDNNNGKNYISRSKVTVLEELPATEYRMVNDLDYNLNYRGPVELEYTLPSDSSEILEIRVNGEIIQNFGSAGKIHFSNTYLDDFAVGEYSLYIYVYDNNNYTYYASNTKINILEEKAPTEYRMVEDLDYYKNYHGPVKLEYALPSATSNLREASINDNTNYVYYDNEKVTLYNYYLDSLEVGNYELFLKVYDSSNYTYYVSKSLVNVFAEKTPISYTMTGDYTYYQNSNQNIYLSYVLPASSASLLYKIEINGTSIPIDKQLEIEVDYAFLNTLDIGTYDIVIDAYDAETYENYRSKTTLTVLQEKVTNYNLYNKTSEFIRRVDSYASASLNEYYDGDVVVTVNNQSLVLNDEYYYDKSNQLVLLTDHYLNELETGNYTFKVNINNTIFDWDLLVTDEIPESYSGLLNSYVFNDFNEININTDSSEVLIDELSSVADKTTMTNIRIYMNNQEVDQFYIYDTGLYFDKSYLEEVGPGTYSVRMFYSDSTYANDIEYPTLYSDTTIEVVFGTSIAYIVEPYYDSTYDKNTGGDYSFYIEPSDSEIQSILIDGREITNYSINGEKLIISVNEMQILAVGSHTLEVNFIEDYASTSFEVVNTTKASLLVTIKDEDNNLLENASIVIYDTSYQEISTTYTDSNGQATITDLELGTYRITYASNSENPNLKSISYEEVEFTEENSHLVVLKQLLYYRTYKEFDVYDDTYQPIENVEITVYDLNNNFAGKGTSDENGVVIIENLREGDNYYQVTNYPNGYYFNSDKNLFKASSELVSTVLGIKYNFILDHTNYVQGKDNELTGTVNIDKSDIISVFVDNEELDHAAYNIETVEEESKLTISSEFLDTLSLGNHTITIQTTTSNLTQEITIEKTSRTYYIMIYPILEDRIFLLSMEGYNASTDDKDYVVKIDDVEVNYEVSGAYIVLDSDAYNTIMSGTHVITIESYYGYGKLTHTIVVDPGDTQINEILELIPEYIFVTTKEVQAFDEETEEEIRNQILEILENNDIDISTLDYNLNVKVNELNHIYQAAIFFVNKDNEERYYSKSSQIVYSNADDYNASDNEIVKEFVETHELVYTKYYNLGENFDLDSIDLDGVDAYLQEQFKDTNISYIFKPIGFVEELHFVGNVFLFVNDKYYGVEGIIINNGIHMTIPYSIKNDEEYILEKVGEFLETKGITETLTFEDGNVKGEEKTYVRVQYTKEEATIEDVYDLLNREYEINISEKNTNLFITDTETIVGHELTKIINQLLEENNIDLSKLGYTFYVEEGIYNSTNNTYDIYKAGVYFYKDNEVNYSHEITVNIKYSNTEEHSQDEENTYKRFVENNSFDFIYEQNVEEERTLDYFSIMREQIENLIEDENITVRVLDLSGGSSGYEIEWPYLYFINGKYYGLINAKLKITNKVLVPYGVEDKENYVLQKIRDYYVTDGYTDNREDIIIVQDKIMDQEYDTQIGILSVEYLEPTVYSITLSSKEYKQNSETPLEITLSTDINVTRVEIDGVKVTYTKNNQIITISSEVLKELNLATHEIKVWDINGYGQENFEIIKKEVTLEDIEILLNHKISLDIEEINVYDFVERDNILFPMIDEKIYDAIMSILNNSEYQDENITITTNFNGYGLNSIYLTEIEVYKDNNLLGTIELELEYQNTQNHTEEEKQVVENFIEKNEYNFTKIIEDNETYDLDELVKSLASQDNIKAVLALPPYAGSSEDIPYALFVNNKYYGSISANLKEILKIKVPYNETNTDTYVIERVKSYYELEDNTLYIENNKVLSEEYPIEVEFILEKEEAIVYNDITDNNLVYEKLSNRGITITFDQELDEVLKVTLNDIEVPKDAYSVNGNKLVISHEYLDTVTNERYALHIDTLKGYANTELTIIPKQYVYLEGANAVVIKEEDDSLRVRINAEIYKFITVYINGVELDVRFYTLKEGSTIINIIPEYLETLKVGVYELKALFTDGEAITHFQITDNPKEYDVTLSNNNYTKGDNTDIVIYIDDMGEVESIVVNDAVLSTNHYMISTNKIILRKEWLEQLLEGDYKIVVNLNDGNATTSIQIKEAQQPVEPVVEPEKEKPEDKPTITPTTVKPTPQTSTSTTPTKKSTTKKNTTKQNDSKSSNAEDKSSTRDSKTEEKEDNTLINNIDTTTPKGRMNVAKLIILITAIIDIILIGIGYYKDKKERE